MKTKTKLMSMALAFMMLFTLIAPGLAMAQTIIIKLGDANQDDKVNTADATCVLKHCSDLAVITDPIQLIAADANQNGEVNTADATAILRAVAFDEDLGTVEYSDEPGESEEPTPSEEPSPYADCWVIVMVNPENAGIVKINGEEKKSELMPCGNTVTVECVPNDNYRFVEWRNFDTNSFVSNEISYTFNAYQVTLVAVCEAKTVDPTTSPTQEPTPSQEPTPTPTQEPEGMDIYTYEDLKRVNNNLTGVYHLRADIDLSHYSLEANVIGDMPIGNTPAKVFEGEFYGHGHKISGLNWEEGLRFMGLFYYNAGLIDNLYITDVNFIGATATGAFAVINTGTIRNCAVTGTIKIQRGVYYDNGGNVCETTEVGGFVGQNYGLIDQCWTNVTIVNDTPNSDYVYGGYTGCIAGRNANSGSYRGIISNCMVFGSLTMNSSGAIVGVDKGGRIENTYSIASITSLDGYCTHTFGNGNTEWLYPAPSGTYRGVFSQKGLMYYDNAIDTYWDERATNANSIYGKALNANEFTEQTLTAAGWSTSIWDFSGQYPTLRNNPVFPGMTVRPGGSY